MYSMMTTETFNKLPSRPPLIPAGRSGVGIAGNNFEIEGVAHLNMQFFREDGSSHVLEYQPILISSGITSNISGMQTELKLKGTVRDNDNKLLTFIPQNDASVVIKYWRENIDVESACIHVARIAVIPTNSSIMLHSKIKNAAVKVMSETTSFFEPIENIWEKLEMSDVFFQSITKHVKFPIYNRSDEEIRLKKGETLGTLNCLETVNETVEMCAESPEKSDDKLHHLDPNQRNQVVKALKDCVQQLAEKPEVSLIQHEIRVRDVAHVRRLRRVKYENSAGNVSNITN
eukprot:gene19788-21727_t